MLYNFYNLFKGPILSIYSKLNPILIRKPSSPKFVHSNNTMNVKTSSLIKGNRINNPIKTNSLQQICMGTLPSLFYYGIEWMSVIVGFLTTICSLGILLYPEFMTVVIIPILTTFLANYQVSLLLGAMGIEWIPEVPTYWSIFSGYLYYSITTIVNIPLYVFDKSISILLWWNTAVLDAILMGFGFIGLWASLKVLSIIKFIYASTIAALAAGDLSGFIPSVMTFIMQSVILTFLDPIAELIAFPSLGRLVTFILPDPLGLWNALISVNLIPWTLIREIAVNPATSWLITNLVTGSIFIWNILIQDITWLGIDQILHISMTPTDIIAHIFGPLDQRLGSIISSIQSLRSIWR
jgi:hypothetical protein